MTATQYRAAIASHTSGPWRITEGVGRTVFMPNDTVAIRAAHGTVACLYKENWPHGQDEANANLIAAAPDMLAALKEAAGFCEASLACDGSYDPASETLEIIQAAIAKATGKRK